MEIKRPPQRPSEENIIPLINIVFLMLIFFLIAGSLRSFSNKDINPADINHEEKQQTKKVAMRISSSGQVLIEGREVSKDFVLQHLEQTLSPEQKQQPFNILVDRDLDAALLIAILESVNKAGVTNANIVALRRRRE